MDNPSFLQLGDSTVVEADGAQKIDVPAEIAALIMPADPEQEAWIQQQLKDPFNAYCVDCKEEPSTHFNCGFGVWICGDCAKQHISDTSERIKPAFGEIWDSHTLKLASMGGN